MTTPTTTSTCTCESGHALLCPAHAEEAGRLMALLPRYTCGLTGGDCPTDIEKTKECPSC